MVKIALAYIISFLPLSFMRGWCYRALGYRVAGAYIGWGTVIAVDHAELVGCRIGRMNRFVGPMKVSIKRGAQIGNGNKFACGQWSAKGGYARRLDIGENCLITGDHYFDVAGSFSLGNQSWIGGVRSQFWTHGPGSYERDIRIGERCYIGSGVMFAPGSSVGDNTIVALGSVVTKPFQDRDVMLAGQPAKIVRENYDWKAKRRA